MYTKYLVLVLDLMPVLKCYHHNIFPNEILKCIVVVINVFVVAGNFILLPVV